MTVRLAAILVMAAAATAQADVTPVPDQPAVLRLDDGWTADKVGADGPAVVMRDGDAVLAVTVAMAPNTEAWRTRKRKAYVADIVAGFEATKGVKVIESKSTKVGDVPAIDLWLERDDEEVAVRVLLFRTRTISVAVRGGSHATRAAAIKALAPK